MGWIILGLFILAGLVPRWMRVISVLTSSRSPRWVAAAGPVLPMALFSLVSFGWLFTNLPKVASGHEVVERLAWVQRLGLEFHFVLDGLGLLMALLITGIGTLVLVYGSNYLHDHPSLGRFFSLILLFMGSMLGVVLSGNALLLFVFWELTSITSFMLIGLDHQRDSARAAAWQALLVTGGGGLALLAGLLIMGQITGTYAFALWAEQAQAIQSQPVGIAAFLLILLGAMTKSAIFPFHFWLPNAMEAPTPVSAYLHSATMVKAGLYLMARLFPVFGAMALWQPLLVTFGMLTLLAGGLLALGQTDLKKLLAYTTIAALGTILLLLGLQSTLAIKGAMVFLFAHALYKGALFLAAGSVDHGAGTRDVRRLGGLAGVMPFTMAASGVAALSMAGIPPLFGFVSKELLYENLILVPTWNGLLVVLTLVAFVVIAAVAGWIGLRPFWGKVREDLHAHESSPMLWLPPLLLAALSLLFGLFPQLAGSWIVAPAMSTILGGAQTAKLSLWHGINPVLGLSVLTILLGGVVYVAYERLQPVFEKWLAYAGRFGPGVGYQRGWKGVLWLAAFQTRLLQNGFLRNYVATVILATVGLVGLTLLLRGEMVIASLGPAPRFYDVILIGVILVATLLVVRNDSRLATIALLGSIGFSIALLFLLYSAPDLAMVQFAIETLTVILFVLVIYRLPKFAQLTSRKTRLIDSMLAILGGLMMTILMLITSSHFNNSLLAPYFLENSLSQANGRNVVNVILVDFRGLDTLGEITVLAIAAIGVSALLGLVRRQPDAGQREVKNGR